jgi:DNA-directed RNA polymerase II subunit RPB2
MREKEIVMKKQHITAKGVKDKLSIQPIIGSMIGEEEKEAILANGMSSFLNSSFMEKSDDYMMAICNKTGMIAVYNKSQNIFYSPYADGPIQFHVKPNGKMNVKNISRFGKSFSLIKVPYAFKLLIQELQVMNIQMRIITDANINQFESMNFSNNINKLLKVDEKKPIEEVVSTFVTNMKLKLTNTKVLKIPEKEENLEEEIKDEVLRHLHAERNSVLMLVIGNPRTTSQLVPYIRRGDSFTVQSSVALSCLATEELIKVGTFKGGLEVATRSWYQRPTRIQLDTTESAVRVANSFVAYESDS